MSLAVDLERLGVVATRIVAAAQKRTIPTGSLHRVGAAHRTNDDAGHSAELMRPGLAAPKLFTWAKVAWAAVSVMSGAVFRSATTMNAAADTTVCHNGDEAAGPESGGSK